MSQRQLEIPATAEESHDETMSSALRVAVVTGCSRVRGIGHAVCTALLDRGLAVIGMDVQPLNMASPLRSNERFRFRSASVLSHTQVYDAIRGGLDDLGESSVSVVVNNAAVSDPYMKTAPAAGREVAYRDEEGDDVSSSASGAEDAEIGEASAEAESEGGGGAGGEDQGENNEDGRRILGAISARLDEFDSYISTNLRSAFLVTEVCRPFFPPRRRRSSTSCDVSIIHVGSTRSRQSERPPSTDGPSSTEGYASSKSGLVGLMHSQGQSLAGRARVNVVSPGWVDTDEEGEYIVTQRDREWHAAGRVGTPGDVAELVAFLADEERSGFVTCEEFVIDGGVSRRMYYPG